MNQMEIEVRLLALNENDDILRFNFDSEPIDVNLNKQNCQNDLKSVFIKILNYMIKNDVTLNFSCASDYPRKLYTEVCEEYINDLNRELLVAREKLNEISNQ